MTRTMNAFPAAALMAAFLSACGPSNPGTDSGPLPTDDGGMPDVDTGTPPPPDGGVDTGTDGGGTGMTCSYDEIFNMEPVTGGPMMPPEPMPGSEDCTACACTVPSSGTCRLDGTTSCNSEHLPTGYTYSRAGFPALLYERIRHDQWFATDLGTSEWNSGERDGQILLGVGGLADWAVCGMEGVTPTCWSLYREQSADERWFRLTFEADFSGATAEVHYEGTPVTELYTVGFAYIGDAP